MTLLSLAELKQFPEFAGTAVEDDALQLLLDAAEQAIDRELGGSVGLVSETVTGSLSFITARRRIDTLVSLTETYTTPTILAADDYRIALDRRTIFRLDTGTNPGARFPQTVTVEYVPEDDEAERKRVQAALVALDLNYVPGTTSEQIGSWMEQHQQSSVWNVSAERRAILATLYPALDALDFA